MSGEMLDNISYPGYKGYNVLLGKLEVAAAASRGQQPSIHLENSLLETQTYSR